MDFLCYSDPCISRKRIQIILCFFGDRVLIIIREIESQSFAEDPVQKEIYNYNNAHEQDNRTYGILLQFMGSDILVLYIFTIYRFIHILNTPSSSLAPTLLFEDPERKVKEQ